MFKQDALDELREQVERRPVIIPIQTLAPHPVDLLAEIHAVVQFEDGAYVASFFDANMNASGESQLDAVESLKETLVSSFCLFTSKEDVLGPEPRRQLHVLRQFMRMQ